MEWTPLEDEYDAYRRQLEEAEIEGLLNTPQDAVAYGYPTKLSLTEEEKEEVAKFVRARMGEAIEHFNSVGGVQTPVLAQILLTATLCGMMWERERIGR